MLVGTKELESYFISQQQTKTNEKSKNLSKKEKVPKPMSFIHYIQPFEKSFKHIKTSN
jgi:hypothetical protein